MSELLECKYIPICGARGYGITQAIVDDADYKRVKSFKWSIDPYGYPIARAADGKNRAMHRFIINAQPGYEIDHVNRNKLDNRRCNLRIVTRAQNLMNRAAWGKIKYKGVCERNGGLFVSRIYLNKKEIVIGLFRTPELAAIAFDAYASKYYGECAWINFPNSKSLDLDEIEAFKVKINERYNLPAYKQIEAAQ